MADVTNFMKEDRDGFANWFIICALTESEVGPDANIGGDIPYILKMQLNGIEIDPIKAIDSLEKQMNRMVEERALEMVEETKKDILEPFEEKVEDLTNSLDALIKEKITNKFPNTEQE